MARPDRTQQWQDYTMATEKQLDKRLSRLGIAFAVWQPDPGSASVLRAGFSRAVR
jgi:hypothetical protein